MIQLKSCVYPLIFAYYVVIPVVYFTKLGYFTYSNKMTTMGTILVTGGAGYVGSHTVIELLNNNYSIIAIDNLVNCYAESQDDLPESLKRVQKITGKTVIFYNIDISNKEALARIFKAHKINVVIHFAALKAVGESISIPLTYYQNNIAGSSTLFQVMQDNGVKKIVFSSSATVYGTPQYLPITEEHPTGQGCTNPYGKSKFFVEEILKDVCISDPEWRVILLRYFNPVGAHESGLIGENPTGTPNNLMPYISQVAIGQRKKLSVFGADYDTPDGTGVRDYIHIVDLAIGHLRAVEKINEPSFVGWVAYNLGTGIGYSVLEVVNAFSNVSKTKINYEIVQRREGDVAACYADATKAAKELNWTASRNMLDMCHDAWRWQSNNPYGFQNH